MPTNSWEAMPDTGPVTSRCNDLFTGYPPSNAAWVDGQHWWQKWRGTSREYPIEILVGTIDVFQITNARHDFLTSMNKSCNT